jgi:hypothetical protein
MSQKQAFQLPETIEMSPAENGLFEKPFDPPFQTVKSIEI